MTARCERCDALRPGSRAPAFAVLTFGTPEDAGLYWAPVPQAEWWLQPIEHASMWTAAGRHHFPAREPGLQIPLRDPRARAHIGSCRVCRKPVRMKVGELIRRAERALRAGGTSVYV